MKEGDKVILRSIPGIHMNHSDIGDIGIVIKTDPLVIQGESGCNWSMWEGSYELLPTINIDKIFDDFLEDF